MHHALLLRQVEVLTPDAMLATDFDRSSHTVLPVAQNLPFQAIILDLLTSENRQRR